MPPTSSRYVPIRDGVYELLVGAASLAEVKTFERDREAFENLAASMYPAVGVFFADATGEEEARWAGGRRDHVYRLEVHGAARSLQSRRACEDELMAFVEAVEDALRAAPTLGGLVRDMAVRLTKRQAAPEGEYWLARAVVQVVCEKAVGG